MLMANRRRLAFKKLTHRVLMIKSAAFIKMSLLIDDTSSEESKGTISKN